MGLFDSIFGGGLGVTEKVKSFISPVTSISLPSLPSAPGTFRTIVRGGEEAKAASTAAQSQAARTMKEVIRAPIPQRVAKSTPTIPLAQPLSPGATAVDIVRATNIAGGAITTETRAGGVAFTGAPIPPNIFVAIFGGEQPGLSGGITFEAPSVPEGDAASVIDMITTGEKTKSGAEKVRDERALNIPNPFAGLFDLSNTTKIALFGLAAIAVFGLTRR